IRYTLTHKPFAAISDWNTDIHADIMNRAALPGAAQLGKMGKGGKGDGGYENCTKPGQSVFDPNVCNWNQINPIDLSSIECATVHLEPHRDGQTDDSSVEDIIIAVRNFVAGGGNFVAQCHGVEYFENADERIDSDESVLGNFITTR